MSILLINVIKIIQKIIDKQTISCAANLFYSKTNPFKTYIYCLGDPTLLCMNLCTFYKRFTTFSAIQTIKNY